MFIDPAISTAFSLSLAMLLAASSAHKASNASQFATTFRNYKIAPGMFAPFASPLVIATEAGIAIGLLVPASRATAAVCAAGLFLAYGAAIAVNLARGRADIDCGCNFGGSQERLAPALILRNAILAGVALATAAPIGMRSLGLLDYASAALFAVTAAALYITFESLRANAARFHAAGHIR